MAVFIRRFLFDPGDSVLLNVESVDVLDLEPPGSITGVGTGTALIVGEFENGPFGTVTQVASATDLSRTYGLLGYQYGTVPANNPCSVQRFADGAISGENWNGNGFVQLQGKQFAALCISRVDTSVGSVNLTLNAFVTGGAGPTYALAPGQVLSLDIGAGPVSSTFNATAATENAVANVSLTGTVSVTQNNANITFSQAQTLAAGTAIVFASQAGVYYTIQSAVSASTSATLTANYTGTTAGATTSQVIQYQVNPGDTVTFNFDQSANFTVVFQTGDNTLANVIARINAFAGFAFAAASGAIYSLTGLQKGNQGQITVVGFSSAGVGQNLGLATGTVFGTGNVANIAKVQPAEVTSVVQTAMGAANVKVEVDQNGLLRVSNIQTPGTGFIVVTPATTATGLGFTSNQAGQATNRAVMLGTGGTFPTTTSGTLSMSYDSVPQFNVSITNSESLANVVAAINAAAGATIAIADGTQLVLVGVASGGNINIVSAPSNLLTTLGLSIKQVIAPPPYTGLLPAGTVVQTAAGTPVFVTMQDVIFQGASNGTPVVYVGQALPQFLQTANGPYSVKVRHALDNGTGLSTGTNTIVSIPTPPTLASFSVTNPLATTAALTEAQIDAAYVNAMVNFTTDINTVAQTVNMMWSARQSNTIRGQLRQTALLASSSGCFGRMAVVRPPLGTLKSVATSGVSPGVGATRDQRVVYCYPGANTFVSLIAQRGIAGGLGFTASGNVDVGADGFLASIMSQLPPEENPGQATPFTGGVNGLETSVNAQGFAITDYIAFKTAGVCALRMDSGVAIFQSGVTSVDPNVNPSLVRISRRRMADFIEDSLALRAKGFGKKLSTNVRRKAFSAEVRNFMNQLLNPTNPAGQRIAGYTVDDSSANTPQSLASGVFRVAVKVRTLPSLDAIVPQVTAGENVTVTVTLPPNT